MHPYHCDCDACSLYAEPPLHGQRDSSCSGEIISKVFRHDPAFATFADYPVRDNWREAMAAIETNAVEVDAEPGPSSGFHVHVGIDHLAPSSRADVLYAYLRWEHVLEFIARGRFGSHREANEAVRYQNPWEVYDWLYSRLQRRGVHVDYIDTWPKVHELMDEHGDEELHRHLRAHVLECHAHHDRHSNLNIRTRRPTWEFRLWNSTRSAWRMELFTRLSVALVDPDVAVALLAAQPTRTDINVSRAQVTRMSDAIRRCGHTQAADLLDRQATYLFSRGDEIPSSLSLV